MRSWTSILWLHFWLLPACHLDFADEETGHSFLARCAASPLLSAAEAGGAGRKLPKTLELERCLATSSELLHGVLRNIRCARCQQCPEGCVVVLLLQALAFPAEFEEVTSCSFSLLFYFRAYQLFQDFDPHWTRALLENLPALVNARRGQCAAARRRELQEVRLPPQEGPMGLAEPVELRWTSTRPTEVAVLLAATSSMLQRYQPFINLWRCYALSHGLGFILETDQGAAPSPNWMRWFAAERFLSFYDALLIVDPDQVIVAPCWHLSIAELLGTWPTPDRPAPDVGVRDFGRPQTLNNGVALLRNSPRGWHFLKLLLEKASWLHTMEHDQGPFDETVLEMLSMEAMAANDINESYDSECAQFLFPNSKGHHDLARYAMCCWRTTESLSGPFGERRSQVIRFLDPRQYDVNHVVGARGLSDPALLYHFAGRSKDWDAMLQTFGLEREGTSDCREVLKYVRQRSAEPCVPGGPVVERCEPPEVVC